MQNAETIFSLLLSGLVDGLSPVYCQKTFCCTTNNIFFPNFSTFDIGGENVFKQHPKMQISFIGQTFWKEGNVNILRWRPNQITCSQTPRYQVRKSKRLFLFCFHLMLWWHNFRGTFRIKTYTIAETMQLYLLIFALNALTELQIMCS